MRTILDRLDRLESQNRALTAKVEALESELAAARGQTAAAPASAPSIDERLAVQESRTAEQAQSKVETSERFPVRLTGMVLFNAYRNSENSAGLAFPTAAAPGGPSGGATFRQTIIGLDYSGPTTVWDGKVSGSLRLDTYGGSGRILGQTVRLRIAEISVDWKTRALRFMFDKPLIAIRTPESLAQVGVTALTGAGNLWYWLPQVRAEQGFHFTPESGVRVQIAAIGTNEPAALNGYSRTTPSATLTYDTAVEPTRPGVEGRVEFFAGGTRRIEFAPGFHHSVAHADYGSASTDIFSADWLVRPIPSLDFSGTFFHGTNAASLGGLSQGVVVIAPGFARAVHSTGGWGQLTWRMAPRIWVNLFSGAENPRDAELPAGAISRNLAIGANLFFRLAPNVLTAFEVHQYRTGYVAGSTLIGNHYDLAFAYRF
jgi:hypothetical protein